MAPKSMSGNVVAIRRKDGPRQTLRTIHGGELFGLQVQLIEGTCRNFRGISWPVSVEQRITVPRPGRKKFIALAMGNFFKRSTIGRHDVDVQRLPGHVGSECDLLPVGRPLRPLPRHWGVRELEPLRAIHFAAPQSTVRETYIGDPLSIFRKTQLSRGYS